MISYKKHPCTALASFVRHYWYFEIGADEVPFGQMSFPYGSFDLICYLENPNLLRWAGEGNDHFEPDIFFAGQLTRPYTMKFIKPCRCVGASLYPWAGNMLYDLPAGEFTNQLAPLDVLDRDKDLHEQLLECNGTEALFAVIETYLLGKMALKKADALVFQLAAAINQNPERDAINRQLGRVGFSRRRVEQRFSAATGLSMGMFLRKTRFQGAVSLLARQNEGLNLTRIGLLAGYYDQPHFINEFKAFSGISPGEFKATGLNAFMTDLVWKD